MKVLVITQHIFPIQTPRAHRSTELIKELSRRGIDVTVFAILGKYNYTSFLQEYNYIKIMPIPLRWQVHSYNSDGDGKRHIVDRIMGRLFGRVFLFPDIELCFAVQKILRANYTFDLMISIADPHPIHWGIAEYRRNTGERNFPGRWIADCGDPFMNNGLSSEPAYFNRYEHLFCQQCDYISVPEKEAINGYYKEYRDKIRVIPQGFQFKLSENIGAAKPINFFPQFAYAGTFLKDIRDPGNLLEYLCGVDAHFKFVIYTSYTQLIDRFRDRLGDKLEIRASIPREQLLEELRQFDFLVNVKNNNAPNQIPSKLIDYSLVGRPILNIHPEESNYEHLMEFLEGNYANRYVVPDIERYHISRVVDQFLSLV